MFYQAELESRILCRPDQEHAIPLKNSGYFRCCDAHCGRTKTEDGTCNSERLADTVGCHFDEGRDNASGLKGKHVVDLETSVILAAELNHGNKSDSGTLEASLRKAQSHLKKRGRSGTSKMWRRTRGTTRGRRSGRVAC